ncbi:MAG: RNA 2',3'-cyclic phosphodiesterase [Solirubrobacteraceae bacterium]
MNEERARLFVALRLPEHVRETLVAWRPRAPGLRAVGEPPGLRSSSSTVDPPPGLRMVAPESLHLTLCFLGWRAVREIEGIAAACRTLAAAGIVACSLGDPLWLPARGPRVLAVGIKDPERGLAGIQSTLSDVLRAGGWYRLEARSFRAHVTVARVPKGMRGPRAPLPARQALAFHARAITLYRSRLGSSAARYESLLSVELGSGGDSRSG